MFNVTYYKPFALKREIALSELWSDLSFCLSHLMRIWEVFFVCVCVEIKARWERLVELNTEMLPIISL